MIMSIKSKIRRINRKYRQFVNYGMTALIVALLVGVYSYRQEAVYQKNLDMVAANNVKVEGAGFQGDTNVLTLITQDEEVSLPLMSKEDAANVLLSRIIENMHSPENV